MRKDADPEHADWKTKYCEELLRTKSRTKAALVTPYPWDSIYKMLHEKYSEYDQKFADMVHMVETRLVAWAEEEIWNSLSDATNAKDRAWIADRILSKMDRERWGDKLDVKHTGAIQHLLPQQRLMLLGEAAADQAVFIAEGNVPKQLGTGEPVPMDFGSIERKKSDEEDVIDAEVINE